MLCDACDGFDEIFVHYDDKDGHQEAWNATKLVAHVEASHLESVKVQVDDEHAQYCLKERGFEQQRLLAFIKEPGRALRPIVFVRKPDDSHLLVDGTHRYVLYWGLGFKTIPAYIVPFDVAKAFLVEDYPEMDQSAVMTTPSNMTLVREIKKAIDS